MAEVSPPREIRIIRHCTLFYWWPVWAVGFLMAMISYFDGHLMAIVPQGTKIEVGRKVEGMENLHDVIVMRDKAPRELDDPNQPIQPHLHASRSKNPGVIFSTVLLLVIAITNIPLRGLWSVIVIVVIVAVTVILALLDMWDVIFKYVGFLDIRMNAGGYLLISSVLFVLWLAIFLLFDPQMYMIFTPGQLRVRMEIGDAETAYDATGMTIEKQRSDLFRHWILGLGSGDLIVRTAGAQAHHFDMPNVLFLGRKVREIEEMLRAKQVVTK